MRLFLALNIPADVRRHCFEATAPLRLARPDVRWVGEAQLHLTLKFLGEQPEGVVQPLVARPLVARGFLGELAQHGVGEAADPRPLHATDRRA